MLYPFLQLSLHLKDVHCGVCVVYGSKPFHERAVGQVRRCKNKKYRQVVLDFRQHGGKFLWCAHFIFCDLCFKFIFPSCTDVADVYDAAGEVRSVAFQSQFQGLGRAIGRVAVCFGWNECAME